MNVFYNDTYILYCVTNRYSGKQYIGITRRTLRKRWAQHLQLAYHTETPTVLARAIRKYGPEGFVVRGIISACGKEEACQFERYFIVDFNTFAPNGYNLTYGGDGVTGLPAEIRKLISDKNRGRHISAKAKEAVSRAHKGKVLSLETRKAISNAHKGKVLSSEHKAKLAAAKLGKPRPPRTAEHSQRISEGLKRAWERKKSKCL